MRSRGGPSPTGSLSAMRAFSLSRLFALFFLVSMAELALLVWIGGQIGFWPTVAMVAVTALIGSSLARREGMAVLARLQRRFAEGGLPSQELTDGLIILVAGAFLLTPGVLTDAAGLLGLLPPSRAWIRKRLQARFQSWVAEGRARVVTTSNSPFGAPPSGTAPSPATFEDPSIQDAQILSEE